MDESCSTDHHQSTGNYRPHCRRKSNHHHHHHHHHQPPTSQKSELLSIQLCCNIDKTTKIPTTTRTTDQHNVGPQRPIPIHDARPRGTKPLPCTGSYPITTTSIALTFLVIFLLLTDLTTTTTAAKLKALTTTEPPLELDINNGVFFEYYRQQQQYQQDQPHHRHRQRDIPETDDTAPTSTSSLAATATTTANSATSSTTTAAPAKCEPKILEEIPPDPFYDVTEIVEDAAREFSEFLSMKFPVALEQSLNEQLRDEVRRRANSLATDALQQDENLLAFAIAAPSIHTVVVKFRDNVTIPPQEVHNKSFLGNYWRELGMAWNSTDGSQEWSAPFKDCNLLKGRWLWPFRISFTESRIKIVAAAFIAADVDLCNDALEEIFGRRHGCDRNTTFCLLTEEKPSTTRDGYTCICKDSYYLPNSTLQGFPADKVENSDYDNLSCIPCPGGCTACDQNGVCLLGEPQETISMENLLRITVGSMLGSCILCCLVLAVAVFQHRKCKAIASGMWTVLETILLGIILLYASVALHFFQASTERCLLEPWLRELGFITCYGAIILKLYRHLVDFRTRKAHRWVLRDVDLLKYLGTMVFAVTCYMAAFTASSLDLIETAHLDGLREVRTNTCHPLKWEYVTQISEILILCFGLNLAVASRNANTQFRERQFLVASLLLEFTVSSTFYIARVIYLPELSPGAILLALFLRSQLTNTITLGLVFVPKIWYQHKQALSAKHRSNKHHQDIEITEAEASRTPEDSVCSAEGPTDTYAEISGLSHSMLSHSMVSHSK